MTLAQRALRFLVSRKNIGATFLALIGVALFALGITSGLIGIGLIVGLSLAGVYGGLRGAPSSGGPASPAAHPSRGQANEDRVVRT